MPAELGGLRAKPQHCAAEKRAHVPAFKDCNDLSAGLSCEQPENRTMRCSFALACRPEGS